MKKRIVWLDFLRVIAIIGVIIIHIVGNTINTYQLSGNSKIVYGIFSNVCYISIPIFVMLSGALFLDRKISYKTMFLKYIRRILLVILLFGTFYSALELVFSTHSFGINSIGIICKKIITNDIWAHMWYLYLVIALYLLTPLLENWVCNSSKKEQLVLLIILYVFTIFIKEIEPFLGLKIGFYIPISDGYIFLYLLGNYLYKYDFNKISRYIIYLLGFISFCLIVLFTYFNTCVSLITYTSTIVILLAISIVLLLKNIKIKNNNKCIKLINEMATCTFGIYIIHQFFINIIYKLLKIKIILKFPYIGLVSYTLFIFLISFLIVYLLRKVKFIKKYLL